MADLFELMLTLDLRDDLSEAELTELCRHLGLVSGPATGPDSTAAAQHGPEPVLGRRGAAHKVSGALLSALVPRRGGWALSSRQEVHPDDFDDLGEVLVRLAGKAADSHRHDHDTVFLGWIRHYERYDPEPLLVRGGEVVWPS
ncbi:MULTISPECIES: hypothetical protein [unclassified Streptomyces]|uniref:hypothetical protein n=1 Tax=unclassified Streptomyces TaxID=2593676 RepID=UPI003D74385A